MIKKNFVICMTLMLMLLFPVTVIADQPIKVKYNDQIVNFEVQPIIDNGRVYIPMRAVFEMTGSKVEWDGNTKTAKATDINGNEIKLRLDSATKAKFINKSSFLDVEIKNINGRVLVPLRLISENSGCKVEWSAPERTVFITGIEPNNEKPDEHDISKLYLEYTDPNNRFSLKFPASYDINNKLPNIDLAIIAPTEKYNDEEYTPNMLIRTIEVDGIMDLEQIGKETIADVIKIAPEAKLISQEEITVSGNKAVKLNIDFNLNELKTDSQITYTQKGNTLYEIVVSLTGNTKQDTRDKFDAILSTLQIN